MNRHRNSLFRATASLLLLLSGVFAGSNIGLAAGTAAADDPNRPRDYYSGASRIAVVDQNHLGPCERRVRARDYSHAMDECSFILRAIPNHPTALLLTVEICSHWKSPRCLLDDAFERAVAINPTAPRTFVVLGIYLHRAGKYDKAVQSFNSALALGPDQMVAHYNLALTYLETKQFDLANVHAQRAYSLGATLPGLRDRLKKAGHWDPTAPGVATTPGAASVESGQVAAPAEAARAK